MTPSQAAAVRQVIAEMRDTGDAIAAIRVLGFASLRVRALLQTWVDRLEAALGTENGALLTQVIARWQAERDGYLRGASQPDVVGAMNRASADTCRRVLADLEAALDAASSQAQD